MTLGEGGPGVSVSGSHNRASRSTAASAYDDAKGWHTTSGSRSQSGSGSGNVGTTAGYGVVGGSGAGFSYEFSLNSTSGPSGTSSTSGSASATLSWSGAGDTGQTGGGITARARYGDGEGWQIVSVGPATAAGSEGVPGAGDLGTAAAGDDATFSGDESSRQGQAAPNGKGDTEVHRAGRGTISGGGNADLHFGPVHLSLGADLNVGMWYGLPMDFSGSLTIGAGPGLGAGAGLGFQVTITNANSIDDLNGQGTNYGFNCPIGGIGMVTGHSGDFEPTYKGVSISAGPTIGGGFGLDNTSTDSTPKRLFPWNPDAQWWFGLPNPFRR